MPKLIYSKLYFPLIFLFFSNYCYSSCEVLSDFEPNQSFVTAIGNLCSKISASSSRTKSVKLLLSEKEKESNAFAYEKKGAPVILITDSLLRTHSYSPRLLAFVIGHEMAHHDLGHVKETINSRILDGMKLGIMSILGSDSMALNSFTKLYVQSIDNHFNRQQELDADRYSLKLMESVGYTKNDAMDSLKILLNLTNDSKWQSFFSNHPDTKSRISNLDK